MRSIMIDGVGKIVAMEVTERRKGRRFVWNSVWLALHIPCSACLPYIVCAFTALKIMIDSSRA